MLKTLKLILVAVVFWTGIAVISVWPRAQADHLTFAFIWAVLPQWWAWGLMTPVILAFDYFLPVAQTRIAPRVAAHLIAGPILTIVYWYLATLLDAVFGVAPWSDVVAPDGLGRAVHKMFWNMLIYSLIVGIWQAVLHRRRYAAAELQMIKLRQNFADARLNILRMQLDPHFLFNALNTVSSQVERDPALARKMIEHLGDLLRASLDSQSRQEIRLADELTFLGHYLAIQRIRFGAALTIVVTVEPGLEQVLVPSLFMQPLVENAIRHGTSKNIDAGTITIDARQVEGRVAVRILDDGAGLPDAWSMGAQTGIGLAVTRERVAGLYAAGTYAFDVRRRAGGGTEVAIAFPVRTRAEAPA